MVNFAYPTADKKDSEKSKAKPQKQDFKGMGVDPTCLGNLGHALWQHDEDADARHREGGPPDQLQWIFLAIHTVSRTVSVDQPPPPQL